MDGAYLMYVCIAIIFFVFYQIYSVLSAWCITRKVDVVKI